ncbi:MAG: insulinase family protein [Bowdeniella nasicola]|nr:insulinase family protein [Bowdeniella nasicola]
MSDNRLIATMPAAGANAPWEFPTTQQHTLANGITVLCSHMPGVSVGAIGMSLGYGPVDDPATKAGLASLTTQVMLAGVRGGDAATFGRSCDRLGAHVQSMCTPNGTFIGGYAPAHQLADFAALLAQIRSEATLADHEIELARSRARYSAQMSSSYGQGVAALALRHALYPASARAHLPADGTSRSLQQISAADVRDFYHEIITRCSAQIFICADFTHVNLDRLLAPFATWENTANFTLLAPAHSGMQPGALTIIDWPEEPQTQLLVAAAAGNLTDPHLTGAEVGTQVLGVGSESLLFYRLREQHGWTYGAHAALAAGPRFGSLVIQSAVTNEAATKALAEIFTVWDEFTSTALAPARHHQGVVELVGMLAASAESPLDIVEHAASATQRGLAYDDVATRMNAYHATTAVRVPSDFAACVKRDHVHIVMVGDAKAITSTLPAQVRNLPVNVIAVDDFVADLT